MTNTFSLMITKFFTRCYQESVSLAATLGSYCYRPSAMRSSHTDRGNKVTVFGKQFEYETNETTEEQGYAMEGEKSKIELEKRSNYSVNN